MNSLFQNAINSYATTIYLHQQDSFTDEQTQLEVRKLPLHIYLICKCPIIKLDPRKIKIEKNKIELCFYTTIGGIRRDIFISTENREINNIAKAECNYPFSSVSFFDESGKLLTFAKCGLLLKMLAIQQKLYFEEFDLEVLYVGQAFGSQGERITIDRLKSHDKAQKIYYDTQKNFPDYEIWFLSMVFEHNLYTSLNLNSDLSG